MGWKQSQPFEVIANEELLEQVPGLTARSKNPLKKFAELLFTLMERMDKLAVSDLIQEVMDTTGYLEALKNDKAEKSWKMNPELKTCRSL